MPLPSHAVASAFQSAQLASSWPSMPTHNSILDLPLPQLLENVQVVGRAPYLGDAAGVDAVDSELLRADGAAGRRDAEEGAAVRSRVLEVGGDPRRVDHEVAQLPAVVG